MANESLDDLQRACNLSKENSLLYEAYYEEKKKKHDFMQENEKLKQRVLELENGQRMSTDMRRKMKVVLEASSEKGEGSEDTEHVEALIAHQRKTNDELMEVRKILIDCLENLSTPTTIGVKRMGELDSKPFVAAMKRCCKKDVQYEAVEMCSLWNKHIRDPHWYPFKVIEVEGKAVQVINDEDEKLNELKDEMGEEVYQAVTTAVTELNEYNPSGCYVVPEIWNFKEDRKASVKEAVAFILDEWTPKKRRRGRN